MTAAIAEVRPGPAVRGSVPPALRRAVLAAAGFLLWLVVWEWFTVWGPLSATAGLPSASETITGVLALAVSSGFWGAVGQTLTATAAAIVISAVAGLALGIVMGLYPSIDSLLDPLTQFLRAVPPVVVLPLILLIAGPSVELAIALAVVGGIWPILVQSHVGVRDVDPVAVETARSMDLGWSLTQRVIVLPSALPFFATGVRIAASMALMLTIGAGILGGAPGLGKLISTAQQAGDSARVFALVIWAGVLGLAFSFLLERLEALLVRNRQPAATA